MVWTAVASSASVRFRAARRRQTAAELVALGQSSPPGGRARPQLPALAAVAAVRREPRAGRLPAPALGPARPSPGPRAGAPREGALVVERLGRGARRMLGAWRATALSSACAGRRRRRRAARERAVGGLGGRQRAAFGERGGVASGEQRGVVSSAARGWRGLGSSAGRRTALGARRWSSTSWPPACTGPGLVELGGDLDGLAGLAAAPAFRRGGGAAGRGGGPVPCGCGPDRAGSFEGGRLLVQRGAWSAAAAPSAPSCSRCARGEPAQPVDPATPAERTARLARRTRRSGSPSGFAAR
jgi:hypothetical protein